MKRCRPLVLGAFALSLFCSGPGAIAQPAELAYQARLSADNVNADGPYQFAFSLVDALGAPVWHHDATGLAQPMPANPLTLDVTNGHFAVRLGDTTVTHMSALAPSLFAIHEELSLRVWVRETGSDPWEQLTPDTPLSSAPYALYAHAAGSVPTEAVDTSQLVDGAVTAPKLADNAVTSDKIDDGTLTLADFNLASTDSRYVPKSGGNFTGPVTITDDLHTTDLIEAGTALRAGDNIYVNYDGPEGNSNVYFYDQSSAVNEYLRWDEANDRFVLSDDLYLQYGLLASSSVRGSSLISNGSINLNYDGPDGDAYIYFYKGNYFGEYLRWEDADAQFYLSDDLDVLTLRTRSDLYVNHNGPDSDAQIYFYNHSSDQGEYFEWDDSEERFNLSSALNVDGDIVVGTAGNAVRAPHVEALFHLYANFDGPSSENAAVYFYDVDRTDEYLRWMNADDYFRFSDDLAVQGTISEISDARLKTAIQPLPYGLAETMRLRPVAFHWNAAVFPGQDASPTRQIGLLAQEVAQIIPESVSLPAESDSYYNLSYTDLVPVLIKAVQEQQAQIEGLRAQLDTLEAALAALENTAN